MNTITDCAIAERDNSVIFNELVNAFFDAPRKQRDGAVGVFQSFAENEIDRNILCEAKFGKDYEETAEYKNAFPNGEEVGKDQAISICAVYINLNENNANEIVLKNILADEFARQDVTDAGAACKMMLGEALLNEGYLGSI